MYLTLVLYNFCRKKSIVLGEQSIDEGFGGHALFELWEVEVFDALVDDRDELLDLLSLAVIELEFERVEEAGIIWRHEVDTAFGNAEAGVVAAILDKEFIEV